MSVLARVRAPAALLLLAACSNAGHPGSPDGATAVDASPTPTCDYDTSFAAGTAGLGEPLAGLIPGRAAAGRLQPGNLPLVPSGLATWAVGDYVLANDRIALVIEDVGPSDLYDPWGGRPVGLGRVVDGHIVEPADFGEILFLTGRESVVTQSVSVIADGADGTAAIVRAAGIPAPTPFFEAIVGGLLRDDFSDIPTAIDYVLEPDAEHVDVYLVYHSPRTVATQVRSVMHGFMYTPRMPTWAPELGFGVEMERVPFISFIDDRATSYAYSVPGETLAAGIAASGFVSNFSGGFDIAACGETRRLHARLTVGGPGLDGLVDTLGREQGTPLRTVSGSVHDAIGGPAAGVRVHARLPNGDYLTRSSSDGDGVYLLHVPADTAVELTGWRRGDAVAGPVAVAADATTADLTLAPAGFLHVVAHDPDGFALPVRIQLLPVDGDAPAVPASSGEYDVGNGRLQIEFVPGGDTLLRAPAGRWRVVVSRGYEYELYDELIDVPAGETVEVAATLPRVVDTTGVMCADFHIHTRRSNDSGDDATLKVLSLAADGLEIAVRSDHEYVGDFQPVIDELGLSAWVFGVPSIELTSFELWGHMGVVPLLPQPGEVNAGAPRWQRYPDAADPLAPVETLEPPEVFAAVRARPEHPIVIVNHPRGGANYLDYVGFDPATGTIAFPDAWDDELSVFEFFNDAGWVQERTRRVADWLGLLAMGKRVFTVGSSDSHYVSSTPVGYPRTCLRLGTDDPQAIDSDDVRDAAAAGASVVVGGVYLDVAVGGAGPGEDAPPGASSVHVRVQAASWVDVDTIEVVVGGESTIVPIEPADADPENPVVRFDADIPFDVDAPSYVLVTAYGDEPLDPVHPGRMPFAVANPIFVSPP